MVLDVMAGPDSKDSTCIPAKNRSGGGGGGFASGLLGAMAAAAAESSWPLQGMTVGIPREFNVEELGEYCRAGNYPCSEHPSRVLGAWWSASLQH